jgi:hypothetical protein
MQKSSSSVVADGFDRLRSAVERQVRQEIEERYARPDEQLNWYQRRKRRSMMEKEIKAAVAQRLSHVSPQSLF